MTAPAPEREKCGRLTRRKKETDSEWAERTAAYRQRQAEKQAAKPKHKKSERPPYLQLSREALLTVQEVFRLTEQDIRERVGNLEPHYPELIYWLPRGLRRLSPSNDGIDGLRVDMFRWVEQTYHLKSSEALCDLDCCRCPRAAALNCAAHNASAIESDGFDVFAHNPLLSYETP